MEVFLALAVTVLVGLALSRLPNRPVLEEPVRPVRRITTVVELDDEDDQDNAEAVAKLFEAGVFIEPAIDDDDDPGIKGGAGGGSN